MKWLSGATIHNATEPYARRGAARHRGRRALALALALAQPDCPGKETAVLGCESPCAPIQNRNRKSIYCGENTKAAGTPGRGGGGRGGGGQAAARAG
jgi:hypothetical protein